MQETSESGEQNVSVAKMSFTILRNKVARKTFAVLTVAARLMLPPEILGVWFGYWRLLILQFKL